MNGRFELLLGNISFVLQDLYTLPDVDACSVRKRRVDADTGVDVRAARCDVRPRASESSSAGNSRETRSLVRINEGPLVEFVIESLSFD